MHSRSVIVAVAASLMLLTGCGAGESQSAPVADSTEAVTVPAEDPNIQACKDIGALWRDVEYWGKTDGNIDAEGYPATGVDSPDFRIQLDAIRQASNGVVRTTLDEYYEQTPTEGAWWYSNGIHRYRYANQVQAACERIGAHIDLPG